MTSLRISRVDLGISAAVTAIGVAEVLANAAMAPKPAAAACELGMAGVLIVRRRAPLLVVVCVAGLQVVEAAAGVPLEQPVVPLLASVIAVYALMTSAPPAHALLGGGAMLVAVGVETVLQHKGAANFAFAMVFLVGAVILGRTVHARSQHAAELAERAHTLEQQQEVRAQLAAQEERSRIARELHDVIAHSVGVMVVQAGAAEQMIHRDAGRAVEAMQAVQGTGREALGEMARLLGILREEGAELGLVPAPGLGDLDSLVEEARRSGVQVDLRIDGYPCVLPPGPELSAYRIVQEALTNIRKHAGRARAAIRVTCTESAITAEIDNARAASASAAAVPGAGQGLIGMRERVALYGGTLTAGPTETGGFRVRAQIPVPEQP